ncbi:MAG: flavin monoamine oxidase family protein [Candidatus Nucleicultricaceae bacterium]
MSEAYEKKIAVIGGGLAGLTAAYRLTKHGLNVKIYEAKARVGGRVLSVWLEKRDGTQSLFELGGQNITDGGEAEHILSLCKELGLNVLYKDLPLQLDVYEAGKFYSFSKLLDQDTLLQKKIERYQKQASSIGDLIDQVSLDDDVLRKALKIRMQAYEGVPIYQQSIHHNVDTLLSIVRGGMSKMHDSLMTEDHEIRVGWIEGGNGLLPLRLQEELKNRLEFNKALTCVKKAGQQMILHFSDHTVEQVDTLILAVPAKVLPQIDFTQSSIDRLRIEKIKRLKMGENFKVGYPISLEGWNRLSAVSLEESIGFFTFDQTLFCLYGTKRHIDLTAEFKRALQGLGLDHNQNPGLVKEVDSPFSLYHQPVTHNWADDPFVGGSYVGYSCEMSVELDETQQIKGVTYKSLFSPVADQIYFAGEHTTILDCIGTMEAAVESGHRIAQGVIQGGNLD